MSEINSKQDEIIQYYKNCLNEIDSLRDEDLLINRLNRISIEIKALLEDENFLESDFSLLLIDDLFLLYDKYLQTNEKNHYKANSLLTYLKSFGMHAYKNQVFSLAERIFMLGKDRGEIDCTNNFTYLVRRGEVTETNTCSKGDLLKMMLPFFESDFSFGYVNMALTLATYSPVKTDDWEIANRIIRLIRRTDVDDILNWWDGVYEKGDLEGALVRCWLEKNEFILERKFSERYFLASEALKKYPDLPEWLRL